MSHMPVARPRGFTLIELMVALLLGLLVVAAAGTIFLSNRRVYGTTEAVTRIQENRRAAFEMLARDIREAGGNPCFRFNAKPITIQLSAVDAAYWAKFSAGIHGAEGGSRDSITLYSTSSLHRQVVRHRAPADPVTLDSAAGITVGQHLIACNNDTAIVFAATGVSGNAVQHDTSANCGAGFTTAPNTAACNAVLTGAGYCFWGDTAVAASPGEAAQCQPGVGHSPAFVAAPAQIQWAVASNGRGGTSLYRSAGVAREEIAEGVTALNLTYKIGDASNYVKASEVGDWAQVSTVHASMTFQAVRGAMARGDVLGVDGSTLSRSVSDYIALRNHQEGVR